MRDRCISVFSSLFVFLASREMYTGNYHHDDICLNVTSASREMEDASRCNRQSFWITKRKGAAARRIVFDHLALLFEFRRRGKIAANAMSFRWSRVLWRLTSPSESKGIDVFAVLIIYLVTNVLYLIWLQREKGRAGARERERKACIVVIRAAISASQ